MKNRLGNYTIVGLAAMNVLLWIFFGPRHGESTNFPLQWFAELLSSTALVLMTCTLVLSAKPRFLEPFFGGLDRMYVSHKNTSMTAFLVIFVHMLIVPASGKPGPGLWLGWVAFAGILLVVLITVGQRVPVLSRLSELGYHQWKKIHRFMGLFFLFGIAHALMVEPLILQTVLPPLFFLAILVTIGAAAYLYKQFLWGRRRRQLAYQVAGIKRLNGTVSEVTLAPRGEKLDHRAGQFLYVHFDGDAIFSEPHPFTISSAPSEQDLRLTIKASGDWTQHLYDHLQPGQTASLDGPYGMFDYRRGGPKQVWIAAGIGLTPFLSWMRSFDPHADGFEVDFYYTVNRPEDSLFIDEIEAASASHPGFNSHLIYSSRDGHLSVEKVIASSGSLAGKDIFLCGPYRMVESFKRKLVQAGAKSEHIHYEEFNFR